MGILKNLGNKKSVVTHFSLCCALLNACHDGSGIPESVHFPKKAPSELGEVTASQTQTQIPPIREETSDKDEFVSAPKVGVQIQDQSIEKKLCMTQVRVEFANAIRVDTLFGAIRTAKQNGVVRSLVPMEISDDSKIITFSATDPQICDRSGSTGVVTIEAGIYQENGSRLAESISFPFKFTALTSGQYVSLLPSSSPRIEVNDALPKSFETSGDQLNRWRQQLRAWTANEKRMSFYEQSDSQLQLLPIADTILVSDSEQNRSRHYGNQDLIFVLRSAAAFVQYIFPEVFQIRIGDLSRSDGETPYISSGTERIYLHPHGSHTLGQDADIAYVQNANGSINWEQNFWLIYAILERTGVDLIMSAYADHFRSMALDAYRAGLINSIAVGRFDSPKFQSNSDMNHDKHFHVSVRNSDNNHENSRFSPSDDVYNCYIKLKPSNRGVAGNFCRSPLSL